MFYQLSEYRSRSINRLNYDIGNLHYSQKDFRVAADYLNQVVVEEGWNLISTSAREKYAESQKALGNSDTYLATLLTLVGPENLTASRATYHDQIASLATDGLSSILTRDLNPLIECRLKVQPEPQFLVGTELIVNCILTSFLPKKLTFQKLVLL